MHIIETKNINTATYQAIDLVMNKGKELTTRNGKAKYLKNVIINIEQPYNRILNLKGRTNNLMGALGELFWVFGNTNNINPYLSYMVPRAKDYSDDGKQWYGGYPERMTNGSQIQNVITRFLLDGANTRRALICIYDPNLDTIKSVDKNLGTLSNLDTPCSNVIYFDIEDNKLNMKVVMRSNDVIFGLSNINYLEWSMLQGMVLNSLRTCGVSVFKWLEMGTYIHEVNNLHIYEPHYKQAENILELNDLTSLSARHNIDHKYRFYYTPSIFSELVSSWSDVIARRIPQYTTTQLEDHFYKYHVNKESDLFYYATIVNDYVNYRKKIKQSTLDNLPSYLEDALLNCKKFLKVI